MKAWPVFLTTRRMLNLRTNFKPATICFLVFATITYSDKYPMVQGVVGSDVGRQVSLEYNLFKDTAGLAILKKSQR
jgi:hypothetical protein